MTKSKIGKRGAADRRILKTEHIGPYEIKTHATKGFRTRRPYGIAPNAAGRLYRGFVGA